MSDSHGDQFIDRENSIGIDVEHLAHRILVHDWLHLIVEQLLSQLNECGKVAGCRNIDCVNIRQPE